MILLSLANNSYTDQLRRSSWLRPTFLKSLELSLNQISQNQNQYVSLFYVSFFKSRVTCRMKKRFVMQSGKLQILPKPFAKDVNLLQVHRDGQNNKRS